MIIYKITNTIINKVYIGKTIQSISTRWSQHKSRAKLYKGTSRAFELYEDMRTYGVDYFKIEILDDTPTTITELDVLELKYIREYDSVNNGYNLIYGDLIDSSHLTTDERKQKNKIISTGVKRYWDGQNEEFKITFAQKSMHSISTEKRTKYIKKIWKDITPDNKKQRISKMISSKHKKTKISGGLYKLTSPEGIIYDNVSSLEEFCKDKDLVRGGFYNLYRGFVKSYKGWTLEVLREPKKFKDNLYIFTSPDGVEYETNNMNSFCKNHLLSVSSMSCILNGACKQHKGWVVRRK